MKALVVSSKHKADAQQEKGQSKSGGELSAVNQKKGARVSKDMNTEGADSEESAAARRRTALRVSTMGSSRLLERKTLELDVDSAGAAG